MVERAPESPSAPDDPPAVGAAAAELAAFEGEVLEAPLAPQEPAPGRARSLWSDAWHDLRRNPVFIVSGLLIVFLVLISLTSPVLSSVAALLTIFLVALCDQLLPEPLHNDLSTAAVGGGVLIIVAFALLSWATFREMNEEEHKHPEDVAEESDVEN